MKKTEFGQSDWSTSGSFMNKPVPGWLHPDEHLTRDAGVCYGVRYIGCLGVKISMKSLEFDTRTAVAKESIHRICEYAGLKTANKKRKIDKKVNKILNEHPNMHYAGSNISLTINTYSLHLSIMETAEIIADHQMCGISFASGGDCETMDFVAYVAKDDINGRACHVLECGGGLAQDVITTIGQAFELRYKEFLLNQPRAVQIPERLTTFDEEAWGEDGPEYYNDRPDAIPPSPPPIPPLPQYRSQNSHEQPSLKEDLDSILMGQDSVYDKPGQDSVYDKPNDEPFNCNLPDHLPSISRNPLEPTNEDWYHGPMSRKEAECQLVRSGDFLVRESTNSPGQYVLSGMQNGRTKHLLLVDPDGQVRTKDRLFDNVSHLISFHRDKNLPIVSQDSELVLLRPIFKSH